MRDEVKKNRNRPRQVEMPFLTTPTRTAHSHQTVSGKEAAITSVTELGTTQFVLGIDTCGYTSGSTITCEFGYECTNIGSYRGCCVPGASDCTSTIHTSCINYGQIPNSAQCGPHTLCCPLTAESCFSYGFITDDEPGATFTHVQCHQSGGFGEMFPYPPELATTTAPTEPSSDSPTSLAVEPSDDDHKSSNSTSAGAIAGAVVGSIAFLCLLLAAVYMIIRRRRQKRRQITAATMSAEQTQLKDEPSESINAEGPALGPASLRPLSTIHEQRASTISQSHENRRSAFAARHSVNPSWPLGSNGNPLASHPVDLEKRLSRSAQSGDQPTGLAPPSQQVPTLKVPTPPPPPGTRLVPPPPPPKSPRTSSSGSPRTPSSAGATLQSPRVSYRPVSPIEAAFDDDEMDKRGSWFDDSIDTPTTGPSAAASSSSSITRNSHYNNHNNNTSSINSNSLAAPRALTPSAPILSLQGLSMSNTSSTDFAMAGAADRDPDPVSPVSPIDGDDSDGESDDAKRLSFVSSPSAPGEGDREVDDLVSPVSPNDPANADGRASPATVSPLESRQGSLRGR